MKRLGYTQVEREDNIRIQRENVNYKERREAKEETKPTNTLISDFQPPEM